MGLAVRRPRAVCLALAAIVLAAAACSRQPDFDLIVRGGTVYDGTGETAGVRRADVGITADRITAIGDLGARSARVVIDASGKVVSPGLIDVQSRSGLTLLANGAGESHLRQGVTSEMLAENSPAFWTAATADATSLQRAGQPFDWMGPGGYFAKLESSGTAINVGTMVPLSLARAAGDSAAFIDTAMREGAFGVIDDVNAGASELAAAAAIAGRYDGIVMLTIESPAAADDGALVSVGGPARRIVISGVSRLPDTEAVSDLVRRITRVGQQNVSVFPAVTPYAPAAGASDAPARAALKYGGTLIGTATAAVSAPSAAPDTPPAAFGAFPRLLGQLARDEHLVELREALRRNTSVPASVFQLPQRGIIRENYFADLVVFDERTIADRATFEKPAEYPVGIDYVIVNGVVTVTPNGLTGARPGTRLVHRTAPRQAS